MLQNESPRQQPGPQHNPARTRNASRLRRRRPLSKPCLTVPFALIGGIAALFVTGQYVSVPASVGFIALFGVAVLNGVVLVTYINQVRAEGVLLEDAVPAGTVRPVLMTALVASLGLVPLLVARGAGSEIQHPLATVVVGGLVTSTLLTLLVLPALYGVFERRGVEF